MSLRVVPFEQAHLGGAAELLAARHRADRALEPALSEKYENPEAARTALLNALDEPGALGVAALCSQEVVGFLLSKPMLPSPVSLEASMSLARGALVAYGNHAVHPEGAFDIYREMYAALSPSWLASGLFAHYVNTPAGDVQCNNAWRSLGFAPDLVRTVRSSEPLRHDLPNSNLKIKRATPTDIDDVVALQLSLYRYHAQPPIYAAFLADAFRDLRSQTLELLCDPKAAAFVAYGQDNRPVGLQTLQSSFPYHMGTPPNSILLADGYTESELRGTGVGTTLLAAALDWARQSGYENCILNYLPANLPAARFWTRSGFSPVSYRLIRQVDERIAWAR